MTIMEAFTRTSLALLGFVLTLPACQPAQTTQQPAVSDAVDRRSDPEASASVGPVAASSSEAVAPLPGLPAADSKRDGGSLCRIGKELLALPDENGGRCEAQSCAAANGACVWGGIGCQMVCALFTRDAGTPCTDAAQCKGSCLAPGKVPRGTRTTGACSKTTVTMSGNFVRKGVAGGDLIRD